MNTTTNRTYLFRVRIKTYFMCIAALTGSVLQSRATQIHVPKNDSIVPFAFSIPFKKRCDLYIRSLGLTASIKRDYTDSLSRIREKVLLPQNLEEDRLGQLDLADAHTMIMTDFILCDRLDSFPEQLFEMLKNYQLDTLIVNSTARTNSKCLYTTYRWNCEPNNEAEKLKWFSRASQWHGTLDLPSRSIIFRRNFSSQSLYDDTNGDTQIKDCARFTYAYICRNRWLSWPNIQFQVSIEDSSKTIRKTFTMDDPLFRDIYTEDLIMK